MGWEMANNDVYVSYAWKDEAQRGVVDKLEAAFEKRGVNLKRDRNEIVYGKSIQSYMDQIGAGRHVVLILSDSYFKSDYCMYELREIYKNKNFRSRVNPVVLRNTHFSAPNERVAYLAYWEKKRNELEEQLNTIGRTHTKNLNTSLDDYADFRSLMDELLAILADMNTLTEDIHVDSDFEALLDRIGLSSSKGSAPPNRRNRQPDSQFRREIIAEVRNELAQCSALSEALQRIATGAGIACASGLAEALCDTEYSIAVDELLRPATIKVLKGEGSDKPESSSAWGAAKAILTRLSQLAVLEECVAELEQNESSPGDLSFSIAVTTPFGVEMVSSRFQQVTPRVNIDAGKPDPYGAEAILDPAFEVGWDDDAALESLLREIWKVVFPEGKMFSQSEVELKKLNAALKQRIRAKSHHHYLPVSMDLQSALTRPEFYKKLMAKLSDLTVVYFDTPNGAAALSVDEYDFMTIFREFFNIPSLTGKRP